MRRFCIEYSRYFQFEKGTFSSTAYYDVAFGKKQQRYFTRKLKRLSRDFQISVERKERFSSYIFIASVVRFARPLNIPAKKDFR